MCALIDVVFAYKEDEPVLRGVSLHAAPGQRIALVGETGAGKSTIIRLLARFFDVTGGAVTIDGYDLRQVTQASLRRQLGIVLQDTFLFGGTIRENIRYGRLDATDAEIEAAAQAVGAHEFILKAAGGLRDRGGRERRQPERGPAPIDLLCPGPAGRPPHPDPGRGHQQRGHRHGKGDPGRPGPADGGAHQLCHRPPAQHHRQRDQIVVLDQGEIVEMGTHAELLAKQGRYYNLYTMQWAAEA